VHVVRLATGDETFTSPAVAARFFDGGLAVAAGSEIRVVPFSRLGL
jgi:hypothetical protein